MKESKKAKNNIGILILKTIIVLILVAILVFLSLGYYKKITLKEQNPIATIEVENYGTIKIELYPDIAPNTVNNFIALADSGFYNGLKFHRIVKDFMIQGGDLNGDGTGSPTLSYVDSSIEKDSDEDKEYCIEGEMLANGHSKNNLNLTEGTIAMARANYTNYSSALATESYNSAGSQFFIMTTNKNTALSGYYTGFGKVIEGLDVVHKIEEVECTTKSEDESTSTSSEVATPVEDVIITSITIEKYGIEYDEPETIEPFNLLNWYYSMQGISY